MDCSPPGSSVHGILQARILEWVAMPPPGKSSQLVGSLPLAPPEKPVKTTTFVINYVFLKNGKRLL